MTAYRWTSDIKIMPLVDDSGLALFHIMSGQTFFFEVELTGNSGTKVSQPFMSVEQVLTLFTGKLEEVIDSMLALKLIAVKD